MDFLHPANAEEIANITEETGVEVLRGPLRYPSETGGWQLGEVNLSEHLSKYRDCEFVVIIAATGKAEERIICGICGAALDKVEECLWCRLSNEKNARRIRARRAENEAMLREVERILRGEDGQVGGDTERV